ncbi:MAG TPA: DUF58 domain-containing protein [Blastocatellia bacterium]|nr:DUF58 domain-containing protein [Blastocatellia bacterium]
MNRQAWRDFFITAFFLGIAFVIALLSSIAAERNQALQAAIAAAISLLLALLGALYIIPRLARNVRLEILRFAVRTSVTVEGLLFIVFLAVIAFAAWNTGNNLLYLVFSAMMAFLVAANLIARMSLADMSVQLRFPDHIFAGEPANITVTIINHKRFMPSYSMMVEALADELEPPDDEEAEEKKDRQTKSPVRAPHKKGGSSEAASSRYEVGKLAYFVLAPARTSARLRVEHTFERRGRYPITGFRISTKFPAGFFKKWRRIDASGEILVYPKPQRLDDFYHALPMLAGRIQSHARGSGDDLYAIRRYHPSDHMRNIDWKATAKSSDLMVREHMREDEWRLTIVFDTARPEQKPEAGDGFDEKFERAVVMAASLANHFILERADVELITPGDEGNVASGSGYDHLYKILRSLATLQPATAAKEAEPGAAKGRSKWSLLRLGRGSRDEQTQGLDSSLSRMNGGQSDSIAWRLLDQLPMLADDRRFKVLITSAQKGTIPASVWRSAHVVFMDDL